MGRKAGLVAAVVLLFAVMGVLAYVGLRRIRAADVSGLASLPRNSIAVVGIDAARVRAYPPAQRIRTALLHADLLAASYQSLVHECGFDPADRVRSILYAWNRMDMDDGVGVVAGSFTVVESTRCLTAMLHRLDARQMVPAAPIATHSTVAVTGRSDTISADSPRLMLLNDRIVVGSAALLPTELNVIEHREAGADRNDSLRAALGSLGSSLFLYTLFDVQAYSQIYPGGLDEVGNAIATGLPPWARAVSAGIQTISTGIQETQSGGVRLQAVANFRTADEARTAASLLEQSYSLLRTSVSASLLAARAQGARELIEARASDPRLDVAPGSIDAMFALADTLFSRLHIHAEGTNLRVDLDVTRAEVTTMSAGIEGIIAMQNSRAHEAAAEPVETLPTSPVPPTVPTPAPNDQHIFIELRER